MATKCLFSLKWHNNDHFFDISVFHFLKRWFILHIIQKYKCIVWSAGVIYITRSVVSLDNKKNPCNYYIGEKIPNNWVTRCVRQKCPLRKHFFTRGHNMWRNQHLVCFLCVLSDVTIPLLKLSKLYQAWLVSILQHGSKWRPCMCPSKTCPLRKRLYHPQLSRNICMIPIIVHSTLTLY